MLITQKFIPALLHLVTCAFAQADFFYKSHDLSSLGVLESDGGAVFYDSAMGGAERPLEDILGDGGMNTIKLRLFVDPTDGNYSLPYTLALAKRLVVEQKGRYRFILNMHLSNTWADPTKQGIPHNWPTEPVALAATLRKYIKDSLAAFCAIGANPSIVMIGNEESNGILWPVGQFDPMEMPLEKRTETMKGFAQLWKAARTGVDDVVKAGKCPKPDVMMHFDAGWDTTKYDNIYTALFKTGIIKPTDIDVFGLTNYPYWGTQGTFANVNNTVELLTSKWGRKVHLIETDYPVKCSLVSSEPSIPYSPEGQIQWVGNLTKIMKALPNGAGQGVGFWEGAWLSLPSLGGGGCDDALLFDQEYSKVRPNYRGTSRLSVNIFKETNGTRRLSNRSVRQLW